MSTCASCQRPTVPYTRWADADQTDRLIWRAAGMRQAKGRGLCSPCYWRENQTGGLIDFPRVTMRGRDLLEDWAELYDRHKGLAENCRDLAPRFGKSADALEKALWRAGWRANGNHIGLAAERVAA